MRGIKCSIFSEVALILGDCGFADPVSSVAVPRGHHEKEEIRAQPKSLTGEFPYIS